MSATYFKWPCEKKKVHVGWGRTQVWQTLTTGENTQLFIFLIFALFCRFENVKCKAGIGRTFQAFTSSLVE